MLLGGGVVVLAVTDDPPVLARWRDSALSEPSGRAAAPPTGVPGRTISLSATGDIIMGNAPGKLPPDGGDGFFAAVREALRADLVMGNLEEPITDDTGTGKCGPTSKNCFQYRVPPSYAGHLRDAGFELLNQANNHGHDYGPAGFRNTQQALEEYGLKHTGAPDEITVIDVEGVRVAVAGFSSYPWSNPLVDVDAAAAVVEEAAGLADIVVVQVHMGAEGAAMTHVKPGTEMYLGENRGDPIKFSHAMVDAGADLIVGHGPHVLRAMEFYKGRLVAYSLGNFAGGAGTLNKAGVLGLGGVLKVSLAADGSWGGGQLVSTYLDAGGKPAIDGDHRGAAAVRRLSRSDFPSSGAVLDVTGKITAPATA
ncbi:CapA family protein [Phytohabitans sp. ZYX-F-186]|uniref:CapA family protein n=1 Tax=Phytohabitans maris TaxID=3071409 RepID=A0ABU0ZIN7_9ACTN|nr:CapA family protein [Phytohabitans sp. ZYX-F-186]MDQ7906914.1 CapA family protein [Phytohabitans sp. ZYX-F-186]